LRRHGRASSTSKLKERGSETALFVSRKAEFSQSRSSIPVAFAILLTGTAAIHVT
jgi:hypothetical protein